MLAEIAIHVVLDQIVTDAHCLLCSECIDGLLVAFFTRAITGSLVVAGSNEIDASDAWLLDTLLQVPPRFDT